MSRSLKGNLRAWWMIGRDTLLLILGVCALITVFGQLGLLSGDGPAFNLDESLGMFGYYLLAVGGFILMVTFIGVFQVYWPTYLSLGSRRKEIMIGMELTFLCLLAVLLVIGIGISRAADNSFTAGIRTAMPALTGLALLEMTLASLIGSVNRRWGRVGMIIFSIVCVGVGAACGFLFAMSADKDVATAMIELLNGLSWKFLAICAVIHVAGVAASWMMNRKLAV